MTTDIDEDDLPDPFPQGCKCDRRTWNVRKGDKATPICEAYEGTGTSYCARCEHDRACHQKDATK